jgi:uncharacterized membrane protein
MDSNFIAWIIVSAAGSSMPLVFVKKYIQTKNILWIVYSVFSYLIVILSYLFILVKSNISIIYPMIKIITDFFVILFGIFLFQEKLNLYNYVGFIFGVCSIYLLSIR